LRPFRKASKVALGAAALIGVTLTYLISFGPACWFISWTGSEAKYLPAAYWPILSQFQSVEPSEHLAQS
jgi:hypothetical protein